jgi:septal ring factor EnvC (AmiA/AmiB activator)
MVLGAAVMRDTAVPFPYPHSANLYVDQELTHVHQELTEVDQEETYIHHELTNVDQELTHVRQELMHVHQELTHVHQELMDVECLFERGEGVRPCLSTFTLSKILWYYLEVSQSRNK